jgi:uncharacterized protein with HEPN domain
MRDDRERLLDILEAIDRIEKRASGSYEAFQIDEVIQIYVVHHLQIIGEAARAVSQTTRDLLPSVPWRKVIGMRNILVHDYFEIDLQTVWMVVDRDLPSLKREISRYIEENPV